MGVTTLKLSVLVFFLDKKYSPISLKSKTKKGIIEDRKEEVQIIQNILQHNPTSVSQMWRENTSNSNLLINSDISLTCCRHFNLNPETSQNQNMNFLASADAKPRLKWSAELHQNFVEAIHQLGGPDKATPKSLMTVMGIPGLTLYHLKSHLQKYRLGKNQQSETNICIGEEDVKNIHSTDEKTVRREDKTEKITQALQMQMEVQRRLHEQMKVQRHLQMRIEAQGKYLQSILKRAHESLSGYCSSSRSVDLAKAELSQLASMVNTDRNGCSFTKPAENEWLLIHSNSEENNQMRTVSTESSFELSEISGIEEEKQQVNKPGRRAEFSLLDIHRNGNERNGMKNHAIGAKRSGSTISDGSCSDMKMKKVRLSEMIDLNS